MTTYTTAADYITAVVAPALGEYAGQYDMQKIAADMLIWENGQLVERGDLDFWDAVAAQDAE